MSGIDAGFLYMETPTLHMHTLKVAILEPTTDAEATPAGLRRAMGERIHLLPPFRRRVVEVPFKLHHPVWIEDPDFDLARHLHFATAPSPGGARELDAVVSAIASTPLLRDRPLWELWLVSGLADGRVAAVAKVHHAVADGVAAAGLLANVMSPEPRASLAAEDLRTPESFPSRRQLLRDALRDHVRLLLRLPGLVRKTLRNLAVVARHRRVASLSPPRPVLDAPRTLLNAALTTRRSFARTSLSLADVKGVRVALGVTVNDVVLALVAASLRGYLWNRGALPRRSLIAEVPVAADPAGVSHRLSGNRVASIFTSLCTDLENPIDRLRRIHDVMAAGKELNRLLGPELFQEWVEYTPPALYGWVVRQWARWRFADHLRPPVNVIVSSVPGPRQRLSWSEGRLDALHSVGPLIEGVGVNVTVWSYGDRLEVSLLVCPDLVPDAHEIAAGIEAAMQQLLDAVKGAGVLEPHASRVVERLAGEAPREHPDQDHLIP
jgi:WS/DGAT/MGAT family acyltransferase